MFPITQIRIARPTNNLKKLIEFYEEGLQFERIGEFENHNNYSGIMLGMPDASIHLEFTQSDEPTILPKPSKDNLLVFYFENTEIRDNYVNRLTEMGYAIVEPENPYWVLNGITIEDPDSWRVVLVNKPSFSIS